MSEKTRMMGALLATAVLSLATGSSVASTDLLVYKCTVCHGADGISTKSVFPTIAGLPVDVQVDAIQGYRKGTRDCGPVPRMCKVSQNLTDDEIRAMAEYFAAKPFKPAEQPFDAALAARGKHLNEDYCEVCHGDSPDHAENGILHGQWAGYLRYSMNQYRTGQRAQPPSMRRATEALSEADTEALVNYYASYR